MCKATWSESVSCGNPHSLRTVSWSSDSLLSHGKLSGQYSIPREGSKDTMDSLSPQRFGRPLLCQAWLGAGVKSLTRLSPWPLRADKPAVGEGAADKKQVNQKNYGDN